jgi:ribosomal-protein-alanine N-acetyltransferase
VIFLETERLLFRAHEARDEPAFVQVHTDPEVRRFAGGRPWSVEEALTRFRTSYLHRPRRTYGLWAAIPKREDAYAGMCGLHGSSRAAYLAFYLARRLWENGLGTEAARAFVAFGFERLHLSRMLATADEGNVRSERILEALGFRDVGLEKLAAGRILHHYEKRR